MQSLPRNSLASVDRVMNFNRSAKYIIDLEKNYNSLPNLSLAMKININRSQFLELH